jgi:sugar phosphate isomerase/epimerase
VVDALSAEAQTLKKVMDLAQFVGCNKLLYHVRLFGGGGDDEEASHCMAAAILDDFYHTACDFGKISTCFKICKCSSP